MTDEELMKLMAEASDEQLAEIVAGLLFPGVKVATSHGLSPQQAIRGVVAHYFESALGRGVWKELGVAERTSARWRSEVRDVLAVAPEIQQDETPEDVQQAYLRLRAQKIAQDKEMAQ